MRQRQRSRAGLLVHHDQPGRLWLAKSRPRPGSLPGRSTLQRKEWHLPVGLDSLETLDTRWRVMGTTLCSPLTRTPQPQEQEADQLRGYTRNPTRCGIRDISSPRRPSISQRLHLLSSSADLRLPARQVAEWLTPFDPSTSKPRISRCCVVERSRLHPPWAYRGTQLCQFGRCTLVFGRGPMLRSGYYAWGCTEEHSTELGYLSSDETEG